MDPNNSAAPAETPQAPVSQEPKAEGSPAANTAPSTTQPAFDTKEVEEWKSAAEKYEQVTDFLNSNPDLLRLIDDRYTGRSKPPMPSINSQPTPGQPEQKAVPVTQEISELREAVNAIAAQKAVEDNEREISETIKSFPFLDRAKLDAAHQKAAKALYKQYLFEGMNASMARAAALDKMRNTPLKHIVYDHFPTELQEFLVKSKTSGGALPPGVGTRGDSVRTGQSSVNPDFFAGQTKAFVNAGGTSGQAVVVERAMREMGLDTNDRSEVQRVWRALREGNPKLLGA